MTGPYDDIIGLPHHVSSHHPQMPRQARAAQFSPFAALTGFGDVIKEKEILPERRTELSQDEKDEIGRKLEEIIASGCSAVLTYFSEETDDWGRYERVLGIIKGKDEEREALILAGGRKVAMKDIIRIEKAEASERMPEEDICLRQE